MNSGIDSTSKLVRCDDPHYLYAVWSERAKSTGLRFGQWVCNNYLKPDQSWPELYHADNPVAMKILEKEYYEGRWYGLMEE